MFGRKKKKLEEEITVKRVESLSDFYRAYSLLVDNISSKIFKSESFSTRINDDQSYQILLESIQVALIVVIQRVRDVADQRLSESYFGLAIEQTSARDRSQIRLLQGGPFLRFVLFKRQHLNKIYASKVLWASRLKRGP